MTTKTVERKFNGNIWILLILGFVFGVCFFPIGVVIPLAYWWFSRKEIVTEKE